MKMMYYWKMISKSVKKTECYNLKYKHIVKRIENFYKEKNIYLKTCTYMLKYYTKYSYKNILIWS